MESCQNWTKTFQNRQVWQNVPTSWGIICSHFTALGTLSLCQKMQNKWVQTAYTHVKHTGGIHIMDPCASRLLYCLGTAWVHLLRTKNALPYMVICLKTAVFHENAHQKNHINSTTIHAVVQMFPCMTQLFLEHSQTSVSGCAQWLSVVSSTNLHFGVCGKKPHQSISPLSCGPLVEPRQEPLQDTTLGIQYYFQIFPDFIVLNSAETPVWGV